MHQRNSHPSSGGGKVGLKLTAESLLMKTKQPLSSITKINMWGNDLGDVSIVKNIPNLEVAGLTINHITTLADFQYCTKLRELFLRGNKVEASLEQVKYLQHLPNLRVLNLSDNPIAQDLPFYRIAVLKFAPNLEKLDDIPVTFEEKQTA